MCKLNLSHIIHIYIQHWDGRDLSGSYPHPEAFSKTYCRVCAECCDLKMESDRDDNYGSQFGRLEKSKDMRHFEALPFDLPETASSNKRFILAFPCLHRKPPIYCANSTVMIPSNSASIPNPISCMDTQGTEASVKFWKKNMYIVQ